MNQELKKQYQWLQVLIFALQLEKWPLEEAIRRDEAFAEVVRFASILGIKVEPGDPEFLPTVAGEIARLLTLPPEQPASNIPKNLQELVEIYEKHLKEEKGRRTARLPLSQQILQEQIKNQLVAQFEPLKQNRELAEEVSFNLSNQVVVNLPPVAIEVAFKKEDYQSALEEIEPEVEHELKQAGVKPEPEKIKAIEKNLVETTFEQTQDLAVTPREKILEEGPPKITPEKGKVFKAEEELERKIGVAFLKVGFPFFIGPEKQKEISGEIKNLILSQLQKLPPEEVTKKNLEAVIKKALPMIRRELEGRRISLKKGQIEELTKELVEKTQRSASIFTVISPRPLPKEVENKLAAEAEGVPFPAYWWQFPLLGGYLRNAIFGPRQKVKKALEAAIAGATPEEKQILQQMVRGLFAEDLEVSITKLTEKGMPPDHPTITTLEKKRQRFLKIQEAHPTLRDFQKYFEPSKRLGRLPPIWEPETRMFLPCLSPAPISGRLQQILNKIGLATRIYQKVELGPGKTVIRPYLSEKFMRFITAQRYRSLLHLLGTALAKSGLGKAVKAGIQALIAAVGNLPGWLVFLVLKVAEFIGKKILKPFLSWFVRTLKEPEKALAAIGAGIAAVVFLPMPIALIGVVPIVLGGIGLISVGVAGAGAIASGLAANVTAFFAILTTAPFTAPIAGLVIAIIGTLAALTFFIVITTAGAFILPIIPTPTRYLEPIPPTAIEPECVDLIDFINDAANAHCVPLAILMAISRMEASGVWGWDCEEVDFFSRDRWWVDASQTLKDRGYCYDTCARTGLCSGTTVVGPMQFEENTWRGVMPGYDVWDRCRLDLSLIAAAKKIKTNSGTGSGNCGPWNEETVRYVAYRYCGSCGTYGCQLNPDPNDLCSPACGYDYCSNVWYLYQQYESR